MTDQQLDYDRRFSGIARLYGLSKYLRLQQTHAVVVGVGGVGSWCAEALVRSGIGIITLIDMDIVSESNTNRQIHAHSENYGKAKVIAMSERLLSINPLVQVNCIDQFLDAENCYSLLEQNSAGVDILIDASDQISAKIAMILWAIKQSNCHFISVGAAGGKLDPTKIQVNDLSAAYQDPLLARIRSKLRREHGFPSASKKMKVPVVFSSEEIKLPINEEICQPINFSVDSLNNSKNPPAAIVKNNAANLSCHGYGSAVGVTACFGFVAASWAINCI